VPAPSPTAADQFAGREIPYLLAIAGLLVASTGLIYKTMVVLAFRRNGVGDDLAGVVWAVHTPIGILASVVLAIGSGALLLGRAWGRRAMIGYAVLALLLTPIAVYIRLARHGQWLADQRAQTDAVPGWATQGSAALWVFFGLLACIYPLLLLYHLTRPHVRRALP
jgi:hypothetical protein